MFCLLMINPAEHHEMGHCPRQRTPYGAKEFPRPASVRGYTIATLYSPAPRTPPTSGLWEDMQVTAYA